MFLKKIIATSESSPDRWGRHLLDIQLFFNYELTASLLAYWWKYK